MEEFLRKIKLLDDFTVQLEIERSDFVNRLNEVVEAGTTETMFSGFEAFSSSKKEYKGSVGEHGFTLRRRAKFFDTNRNMAIAKGKLRQHDNHLVVETEVNSFRKYFLALYILGFVFYAVLFLSVSFTTAEMRFVTLPLVLVHAAFMLGIPYLFMRRSTKRMKYDLEREFHYLASKKS